MYTFKLPVVHTGSAHAAEPINSNGHNKRHFLVIFLISDRWSPGLRTFCTGTCANTRRCGVPAVFSDPNRSWSGARVGSLPLPYPPLTYWVECNVPVGVSQWRNRSRCKSPHSQLEELVTSARYVFRRCRFSMFLIANCADFVVNRPHGFRSVYEPNRDRKYVCQGKRREMELYRLSGRGNR